jgi:single-stranded-DNA-specific exonuclease
MGKSWVYRQKGDEAVINRLSEELEIDQHLANLLVQRGIISGEQAAAFFHPELSYLHDPFLMKDMEKAITRIKAAMDGKEKILVYGDYDVDGTTAVSLVYLFFRKFYERLDFYIPDRYQEGYGVSAKGVDFATENGFTLVISLDCGIKAVENVGYARDRNVDFIICDHHRPGNELPDAAAILDPKQPGCNYPYKELSGCGIGFKLIQAYAQRYGIPFSDLAKYLDLVVVSIASDIVDITGENRVLAYFGLKLLNTNPRPGIEAVLRYSGIMRRESKPDENAFSKELSITDLVFLVGPRINAAGRIESGRNSVRLLVTGKLEEALSIGKQIDDCNTERKNLDTSATIQAIEMINEDETLKNARTTVIFHPDWHKGVIGIVASRLTDTFYRPTIVMTKAGELYTGSARSVKDFDIYEAIDSCSDLLEHFGGHKFAAGLSLRPENFEAFRNRFNQAVIDRLKEKVLVPELEIDDELPLNSIHSRFYNTLKQFAPFGPGNMAPLFVTKGVVDAGGSRIVGKNHLKLSVGYPDVRGGPVSGIAFQQGDHLGVIDKGMPFNICYHIEENEWNGSITLQMNIKDIKPGG